MAAESKDAGVQTSECLLASQYPANLLYAQGMLNTTLLQLQQVELQISRLRDYVHQHQTRRKKKLVFGQEDTSDALFAAAEVLSNVRNVSAAAREAQIREERQDAVNVDPAEALNRQMQRRMLPLFVKSLVLGCLLRVANLDWYVILLGVSLLFVGEYWIIEAPRAQEGQGQEQGRAQENRLPALRQRLSWLFKVLLVMVLMELKFSWYVSCSWFSFVLKGFGEFHSTISIKFTRLCTISTINLFYPSCVSYIQTTTELCMYTIKLIHIYGDSKYAVSVERMIPCSWARSL